MAMCCIPMISRSKRTVHRKNFQSIVSPNNSDMRKKKIPCIYLCDDIVREKIRKILDKANPEELLGVIIRGMFIGTPG